MVIIFLKTYTCFFMMLYYNALENISSLFILLQYNNYLKLLWCYSSDGNILLFYKTTLFTYFLHNTYIAYIS